MRHRSTFTRSFATVLVGLIASPFAGPGRASAAIAALAASPTTAASASIATATRAVTPIIVSSAAPATAVAPQATAAPAPIAQATPVAVAPSATLAAVVSAATATGTCAVPSLANCFDDAFFASCGRLASVARTCNSLVASAPASALQAARAAKVAALTPASLYDSPETAWTGGTAPAAGGTVDTRQAGYSAPLARMAPIAATGFNGTYEGQRLKRAISGSAGLPELKTPEINSCDEYIYLKYQDVSQFEDSLLSIRDDHRKIMAAAVQHLACEPYVGQTSSPGLSALAPYCPAPSTPPPSAPTSLGLPTSGVTTATAKPAATPTAAIAAHIAPPLQSRDLCGSDGCAQLGSFGRVTWPGGLQPKNRFFGVFAEPNAVVKNAATIANRAGSKAASTVQAALASLSPAPSLDADLAAIVQSGLADHEISWDWHARMSDALAGDEDAKLDELDARAARFEALVRNRIKIASERLATLTPLADHVDTGCGTRPLPLVHPMIVLAPAGSLVAPRATSPTIARAISIAGVPLPTNPTDDCTVNQTDLQAAAQTLGLGPDTSVTQVLTAFDKQINNELRAVQALGCLDVTKPSVCDWSPALMVRMIRDNFEDTRAADHKTCVELTANNIDATADYAKTLPAFVAHLGALEAGDDIYLDPATNTYRLGKRRASSGSIGNNMFSASYNYDFGWGATIGDSLCQTNLSADGHLNATATLFGNSMQLLQASASLSTAGGDAPPFRFFALGTEYVNLTNTDISTKIVQGQKSMQLASIEYQQSFVVGVVPVVVGAGASLTAGFDYGVGVRIPSAGNRLAAAECGQLPALAAGQTDLLATVTANVSPWVDASAFVEAAVGCASAGVGVRGNVTLVKVTLPLAGSIDLTRTSAGIQLPVTVKLDRDISTLGGDLELEAFIDLPLVGEERFSTPIFKWEGLRFAENIFTDDKTLDLSLVKPSLN